MHHELRQLRQRGRLMLWDGETLSLPATPAPPRVIPKATIAARLVEIGKAGAFRTAMAA